MLLENKGYLITSNRDIWIGVLTIFVKEQMRRSYCSIVAMSGDSNMAASDTLLEIIAYSKTHVSFCSGTVKLFCCVSQRLKGAIFSLTAIGLAGRKPNSCVKKTA